MTDDLCSHGIGCLNLWKWKPLIVLTLGDPPADDPDACVVVYSTQPTNMI